jgi:hypothetical protein
MNAMRTILTAASLMLAAAVIAQVRVTVDGTPVQFNDQQPVQSNNHVLVPLRGVFEQMGATVMWNPDTQTVTARKDDRRIRLRIGSRDATVDGRVVSMDVAPAVMGGSTMVPLRFISEALGATVDWRAYDETVLISTSGEDRTGIVPRQPRTDNSGRIDRPVRVTRSMITLERATVIPVRLDDRISSGNARKGNVFRVTVRREDQQSLGLPQGTTLDGYVADVHRYDGKHAGMVELKFNKMTVPNQRAVTIDGTLISLDNNSVDRRDNGRLVAKGNAKDNRGVYAGYGAGAGFILGLLTKRPIEDAILGGLLGLGAGELDRRNQKPSEVTLEPGTEFGVRLNQPVEFTIRQ